jgi:hypothetical protein
VVGFGDGRFGIHEFRISRPGRVMPVYAGLNRENKLELSAKLIKQAAAFWLCGPLRADVIEGAQK